eukprot:SAG11_NODE_14587_length_606_cov_10.552268_1_plen_60_part_00
MAMDRSYLIINSAYRTTLVLVPDTGYLGTLFNWLSKFSTITNKRVPKDPMFAKIRKKTY